MPAFRFFDPNPQERDNLGQLCALGTLLFFENGDTDTPKSVFGEPALSTDLGHEIALDASARPAGGIDIWCDGEYTVRLLDSDGAQVWEKDDYRSVDAAALPTLPDPADGEDGQVLGIDTGAYALLDIEGLPDPTGFSSGYLATDGESWFPATFPEAATYDEDNLPGGFDDSVTNVWDFGTQRMVKGTGTCPTSGTTASTVVITFPDEFADVPVVVLNATVGPVTGEQARCSMQALSISATGFTASAFAGAEDGGGSLNISSSVPFNYIAWGTKPA